MKLLRLINTIISSVRIKPSERKSNSLVLESMFMVSCLKILEDNALTNVEKQICIEILALHYENNFVSEILRSFREEDMPSKCTSLLVSLFAKSLPRFIKRVELILEVYKDSGFKLLKLDLRKSHLPRRTKLIFILCILGVERVCSIVFSNVVKTCGTMGGADEMDLISNISDILVVNLKYAEGREEVVLPKVVFKLYEECKHFILDPTVSDKVEIGQTLLDIFLDCYSNLFDKVLITRDDHRVNQIIIKNEFIPFMANLVFNPMRLPMVCKPEE